MGLPLIVSLNVCIGEGVVATGEQVSFDCSFGPNQSKFVMRVVVRRDNASDAASRRPHDGAPTVQNKGRSMSDRGPRRPTPAFMGEPLGVGALGSARSDGRIRTESPPRDTRLPVQVVTSPDNSRRCVIRVQKKRLRW